MPSIGSRRGAKGYKKIKKGSDSLLPSNAVPSEGYDGADARDDDIEKYSRQVHNGVLNDLVASIDMNSTYTESIKLGVDDPSVVNSVLRDKSPRPTVSRDEGGPSATTLDAMNRATMFFNRDVRSKKKSKSKLPPKTPSRQSMGSIPENKLVPGAGFGSVSTPKASGKQSSQDSKKDMAPNPLVKTTSSASMDIFGDLEDDSPGDEDEKKLNGMLDELLEENDIVDETPAQILGSTTSGGNQSRNERSVEKGRKGSSSRKASKQKSKQEVPTPTSTMSNNINTSVGNSEHEETNGQDSAIPVKNSSTSNSSETTPDLAIDPQLLKNNGIVIVDPEQNGEYYHMDEDNKSLTNKDLLIIRKNKVEEQDIGDDDASIISSLTEVTFTKNKRERARRIVEHLREKTSKNAETNPFMCGTFFFDDNDDLCVGDYNEDNRRSKDKGAKDDPKPEKEVVNEQQMIFDPAKYEGEPNISDDAELLFNSIVALTSKGGVQVNCGSYEEKVTVCISRIYIGTEDELKGDAVRKEIRGLRCTWNEPKLSHDIGVRFEEDDKGRAIVHDIIDESTAQQAGVQVGDILSFAVPLNNTFQGYEKACDFISRLELIGMRTCYRELFDMFLSKTSSGWPVALVFRRTSQAITRFDRLPFGLLSVDLNIDVHNASTFLHDLVTQSREFDFWREADGTFERTRGNIEYFMPLPCFRQDKRKVLNKSSIGQSLVKMFKGSNGKESVGTKTPFIPISLRDDNIFNSVFRRSALLAAYAEDSVGAVYVKVTSSFVGSGLAICRDQGGAWSSPCAVGANISDAIDADGMEFVVFIRENNVVQELTKQERVELNCSTNQNGEANCAFFIKEKDSFICTNQMRCEIYARDDLNKLFYEKKWEIESILEGNIPHPAEASRLYGALNRIESPATFYPHPTPPQNLLKYVKHDWTLESSVEPSETLEPPLDMEGNLTLRSLLQMFEASPETTVEDSREFDIFTQKFKIMLYDGVKVDYRWQDEPKDMEGKKDAPKYKSAAVILRLSLNPGDTLDNATLKFLTRTKKNSTTLPQDRDIDRRFQSSLDLKVRSIVGISQTVTKSYMSTQDKNHQSSRKRFICLQVEDGKEVVFLARTGKDASLLSCGLKFLIERTLQIEA